MNSMNHSLLDRIKACIPNLFKRNCKELVRNIFDSVRYYLGPGRCFLHGSPLKGKKVDSIIFVCKGNVCRSAFAEYRLRYLLGSSEVHIDSCGVDVDQGNFPPEDSVSVAVDFSCSLSGRRAKGLSECDMEGADLIFPVEYWQYKRLVQLYPEKKGNILLLRSIAPFPWCLFCNIADPYGWGEEEFRRVYRLVDQSLRQLVRWR